MLIQLNDLNGTWKGHLDHEKCKSIFFFFLQLDESFYLPFYNCHKEKEIESVLETYLKYLACTAFKTLRFRALLSAAKIKLSE